MVSPTKKKTGLKSIFDQLDNVIHCLTWIDTQPGLTLKQIVQKYKTLLNLDTSTTAVDRMLKQAKITWKMSLPIPVDWNTERIITQRQEYMRQLGIQGFGRNVIYIDESGFQLSSMKSSRGRALEGVQPQLTVQRKSKRLNCIAALSKTKVELTKYIMSTINRREQPDAVGQGGVNAEDFRGFLMDLGASVPRGTLLILDNAKIHHANMLEDTCWNTLKATYNIDRLYLPAYSPFLNPIELIFNIVKMRLQSTNIATVTEMTAKVQEEFAKITPAEASNCYQHCTVFYQQARDGIPFTGRILEPNVVN